MGNGFAFEVNTMTGSRYSISFVFVSSFLYRCFETTLLSPRMISFKLDTLHSNLVVPVEKSNLMLVK